MSDGPEFVDIGLTAIPADRDPTLTAALVRGVHDLTNVLDEIPAAVQPNVIVSFIVTAMVERSSCPREAAIFFGERIVKMVEVALAARADTEVRQ